MSWALTDTLTPILLLGPPASFGSRRSQSVVTSFLLFKVPKASPESSSAAEQFVFPPKHQTSLFVRRRGNTPHLISAPIFLFQAAEKQTGSRLGRQGSGSSLSSGLPPSQAQAAVPHAGLMSFLWDLSGPQQDNPGSVCLSLRPIPAHRAAPAGTDPKLQQLQSPSKQTPIFPCWNPTTRVVMATDDKEVLQLNPQQSLQSKY